MPSRGSPGASRRASGWRATMSIRPCTSRASMSGESTDTTPPDWPKPRASHVRMLKPARRSGASPTLPKSDSDELSGSVSRDCP